MRIEFVNMEMDIPESWKDIRLKDYEKWYMLKPETKAEIVQYIADICKIESKILLEAPTRLFDLIAETVRFVFEPCLEPINKCSISNKDYFITACGDMTLGEYVDIDTVLNDNGENKLASILAIICRPAGEKYEPDRNKERTLFFGNLSCDQALPLLGFFLNKKKESDGISNHYSTVMDQAGRFLKDTNDFVRNGDGIKRLPTWQKIRYIYLMKLLKKELSKCSASFYTK